MNIFKNLAIIVLMIAILIILSIQVEAATGTINAETVNLREEPSTSSDILEQLDIGDEVEIVEQAEGWYQVVATVDGKKITGYISESLLDVEGNTETSENEGQEQNQTPEESTNNEITNSNETQENEENTIETSATQESTSENTVTIQENTSYELQQEIQIKILPLINVKNKDIISNGTINVVEVINDWCKVENGIQEGWVRINQLKNAIGSTTQVSTDTTNPEEPNSDTTEETIATENPADLPVIKTAYVNANSLKVRQEPNTSSEVIDSLTRNAQVSIVEELDGWYKIKIGNQLGYVSATYISDEKTEDTTSRGNLTREEETTSEPTETVESTATAPAVSSGNGEAVVAYAKQYLGYKYVSGGASPSTGFDCSGFTSYVYKNFGVTLNRTSKAQINNGVAVEKSNLQAGDIVVFNNDANTSIGHVGIYIGDGNFIHASNPSDGVKITSLSSSYYATRYVGARRVI